MVSLRVFRAKRQYFMPPGSRLGFREETQNCGKRNRSQIFFCVIVQDDHTIQTTDTPGFKPFTLKEALLQDVNIIF